MEFSRVPQEETDMHHKYQFSYMYTQVSVFWMMSTIWILSFLLDGGLTWWRYKISIKTYLLKFMRKYLRIRVIFSKMDLRSSYRLVLWGCAEAMTLTCLSYAYSTGGKENKHCLTFYWIFSSFLKNCLLKYLVFIKELLINTAFIQCHSVFPFCVRKQLAD